MNVRLLVFSALSVFSLSTAARAAVASSDLDTPSIAVTGESEVRSTAMEEARTKARSQAVKAARAKATAMAGELGEKIGRALKINEAPVSFNRFAYSNPSASQTHEGFAPGEIGVQVSVSVEFALGG